MPTTTMITIWHTTTKDVTGQNLHIPPEKFAQSLFTHRLHYWQQHSAEHHSDCLVWSSKHQTQRADSSSQQTQENLNTNITSHKCQKHDNAMSFICNCDEVQKSTDIRTVSSDTKAATIGMVPYSPLPLPTTGIPQSKWLIMWFTNGCPELRNDRNHAICNMQVNEALEPAQIQIVSIEFTQAGNIMITPCSPCTTSQLLDHCDIIGPLIVHGHSMDDVVFDHDRAWHSIVARGMKMPARMHNVKDAKVQIWDSVAMTKSWLFDKSIIAGWIYYVTFHKYSCT
jgi:hypothetical protein